MERTKITVRVAPPKVKKGEREVVDAMKKVTPFSIPDDPEVDALKSKVNKMALDLAELREIVKQYLLEK